MTFIIGLAAVVVLFLTQNLNLSLMLNSHSLELVVGGSVCVFFMLTPSNSMREVIRAMKSLWREERNSTVPELKQLLSNHSAVISDPYGMVNLARDLWELGTPADQYEELLFAHAESTLNRDATSITAVRNLSKYPPALGMVGTVMGMIQLFGGLGASAQQSQVGAQLALAMSATFYGLVLSNYVLMPIADRMETKREIRRANLEQIVRVLVSIKNNQPKFLAERMIDAA
jgi:chemotaxis protein MotA